jgi:aryl-alcohol dehydrogenase-like predicted oxidoreductase
LVRAIETLARARGCTASQLALAWVLARGEHVVPIPGTRRLARLAENAAATEIALSTGELADLDAIAPRDVAAGSRYPEAAMQTVNR